MHDIRKATSVWNDSGELKIRGFHKSTMRVKVEPLSLCARRLPAALPAHAGGVGGPPALHGANCGAVHKKRARSCSGYCLPTVKRYLTHILLLNKGRLC